MFALNQVLANSQANQAYFNALSVTSKELLIHKHFDTKQVLLPEMILDMMVGEQETWAASPHLHRLRNPSLRKEKFDDAVSSGNLIHMLYPRPHSNRLFTRLLFIDLSTNQ